MSRPSCARSAEISICYGKRRIFRRGPVTGPRLFSKVSKVPPWGVFGSLPVRPKSERFDAGARWLFSVMPRLPRPSCVFDGRSNPGQRCHFVAASPWAISLPRRWRSGRLQELRDAWLPFDRAGNAEIDYLR